MKLHSFNDLFLALLSDLYIVENRIVTDFPKMIAKAHSEELKETLRNHFDEKKLQIKRLDKIFKILGQQPNAVEWLSVATTFSTKVEKFLEQNPVSPLLDASIIAMVQRIEHFEIANYGTLVEFANVVGHDEIKSILKESLKEATKTDSILTKVAKGGWFSKGINVDAMHQL